MGGGQAIRACHCAGGGFNKLRPVPVRIPSFDSQEGGGPRLRVQCPPRRPGQVCSVIIMISPWGVGRHGFPNESQVPASLCALTTAFIDRVTAREGLTTPRTRLSGYHDSNLLRYQAHPFTVTSVGHTGTGSSLWHWLPRHYLPVTPSAACQCKGNKVRGENWWVQFKSELGSRVNAVIFATFANGMKRAKVPHIVRSRPHRASGFFW